VDGQRGMFLSYGPVAAVLVAPYGAAGRTRHYGGRGLNAGRASPARSAQYFERGPEMTAAVSRTLVWRAVALPGVASFRQASTAPDLARKAASRACARYGIDVLPRTGTARSSRFRSTNGGTRRAANHRDIKDQDSQLRVTEHAGRRIHRESAGVCTRTGQAQDDVAEQLVGRKRSKRSEATSDAAAGTRSLLRAVVDSARRECGR